MTVIVACWFLRTVAVIADCRVSYGIPGTVDDNLQKIYQIDKRMVLGFSGPLPGAYQVIERIRANTARYSKRPVASNLQTDVERWIRYEYRRISDPQHRKGLTFLLVTVEPRREARSIGRPDWVPASPEFHMVVLKPSQSRPKELVKEEKGLLRIIGIKDDGVRSAIHDVIQRFFDTAFRYPREGPRVIADTLQYVLMDRQVTTVGGLFQCVLLSARGIEWLGYRVEDIALELAGSRYVQRNLVTGEIAPLMTIWEWWEHWRADHHPGDTGAFEDPSIRRAVDKRSKTLGEDAST